VDVTGATFEVLSGMAKLFDVISQETPACPKQVVAEICDYINAAFTKDLGNVSISHVL
jgi:hypothetical protein